MIYDAKLAFSSIEHCKFFSGKITCSTESGNFLLLWLFPEHYDAAGGDEQRA